MDPWNYVYNESPKGYADAIKDWQGCYDYCAKKMERYGDRALMIRKTSAEVASIIADASLDFVYIDANHMSPMIDNDLAAWWPKVKAGGIFGGHDYHTIHTAEYRCDVKSAVDRFFANRGRTLHVTNEPDAPSWYVIK